MSAARILRALAASEAMDTARAAYPAIRARLATALPGVEIPATLDDLPPEVRVRVVVLTMHALRGERS